MHCINCNGFNFKLEKENVYKCQSCGSIHVWKLLLPNLTSNSNFPVKDKGQHDINKTNKS